MLARIQTVSHWLYKSPLLLAVLLVSTLLGAAPGARAQDGPPAVPEAAGSSFNSSFNGSHSGWSVVDGPWNQGPKFYTTLGKEGFVSSIKHAGTYENLVFTVKMRQQGSNTSAYQGMVFRGDPSTAAFDKTWNAGVFFCYFPDTRVLIGELVGGSGIPWFDANEPVVNQTGWNILTAVAYEGRLTFAVNGIEVFHTNDVTYLSGSVGVFAFRPPGDTGNRLDVDWAKLYAIKY